MPSAVSRILFKDPSRWRYWLFLALIFKLGLFFVQIHLNTAANGIPGFWGSTDPDTWGYIDPIMHLVKQGSYNSTYRMPGYGVLYLPLIVIFSKATACNIIIIIQLILASASVYALALCAQILFKSKSFFYFVFYIFLISRFANLYDSQLMTESLTGAFLIFSVYYFIKYFETYRKMHLLLSGALLTWVIFLRPVYIPLILLYCFVLAISLFKLKKPFRQAIFLILLPFLVCDGLWAVRNYIKYNGFYPLTREMYMPYISDTYLKSNINFVKAWGGNSIDWDSTSDINWFIYRKDKKLPVYMHKAPFPESIYTARFNEDSLNLLKTQIAELANDTGVTKTLNQSNIIRKFDSYTASIRHEKPFLFYIKAPLGYLKMYLFDYGTNLELFSNRVKRTNKITFALKLFYNSFLYLFIVIAGCLGIILMFPYFLRKISPVTLLPAIPLYNILIHPVIVRYYMYRYFVPVYPFMIFCGIYAILHIFTKLTASKQQMES